MGCQYKHGVRGGLIQSSSQSVCMCICVYIYMSPSHEIFRGLSLALRLHDHFEASNCSTLLPYHIVAVGGRGERIFFFIFLLFFLLKKNPLAAVAMAAAGREKKNGVSPFVDASGKKTWCYYPHRLKDLVSPVCKIFF